MGASSSLTVFSYLVLLGCRLLVSLGILLGALRILIFLLLTSERNPEKMLERETTWREISIPSEYFSRRIATLHD